MTDRPALPANLEVTTRDGEVIMEPGPVHGTRGFTVHLSRRAALDLGHRLISAAVDLLPQTTKQ